MTEITALIFPQTVKFDQEFYSPPAMITTAEHYQDKVAATIDADNNAIQEWVRVSKSQHALVNLRTSHKIVQQRKKQILLKTFSIPVREMTTHGTQ